MASKKCAVVRWIKGTEFQGDTGSGHRITLQSVAPNGTKGKGASPMELLLVGMAGCTAIDVVDILRKKRQHFAGFEVRVEGTRSESYPKVYTEIDVVYVIRGDVSPKAVEHAIHLSETKYCSASIMLGKTAKIKSRYEIVKD